MSWVAVGVAAISVVGGAISSNKANHAANNAANAQERASQAAIDEQKREYDQSRLDQAPWLAAGTDALGRQTSFLNGDMSGFQNAPDYLYARSEGLDAIDHRAAANGGLFGGGNTRDAMRFASGLATQNMNNYWSKLSGMSGTGQNTAQNLGALGANMATNIGNQYTNAGNARASAYQQIGQNNADFWGNTMGQVANAYGGYMARRGG